MSVASVSTTRRRETDNADSSNGKYATLASSPQLVPAPDYEDESHIVSSTQIVTEECTIDPVESPAYRTFLALKTLPLRKTLDLTSKKVRASQAKTLPHARYLYLHASGSQRQLELACVYRVFEMIYPRNAS